MVKRRALLMCTTSSSGSRFFVLPSCKESGCLEKIGNYVYACLTPHSKGAEKECSFFLKFDFPIYAVMSHKYYIQVEY